MAKKLTLKKEALKTLSVEILRDVAGGVADPGPGLLAAADTVSGCNVL